MASNDQPTTFSPKVMLQDLKKALLSFGQSSSQKQVKEATDLLEEYKKCLWGEKLEEVNDMHKKFGWVFQNNFYTTGYELSNFAMELYTAKSYVESIPFFIASAALCKQEGGTNVLGGLKGCVAGLWLASEGLIGSVGASMKQVVKKCIIPLMCDFKNEMLEVTSVDEKTKCELVVWSLYYIAWCQAEINGQEDLKTSKESLKEGLQRLQKTFGDRAEEMELYATLLEDLDEISQKLARFHNF